MIYLLVYTYQLIKKSMILILNHFLNLYKFSQNKNSLKNSSRNKHKRI